MKKLIRKSLLCLLLLSMQLSRMTSAATAINTQMNLAPTAHFPSGEAVVPFKAPPSYDFSCLSQDQKVMIESAFQQNAACHQALRSATAPETVPTWQLITLSVLAGVIAGMVADGQLHH